jgi:hypothetical protein
MKRYNIETAHQYIAVNIEDDLTTVSLLDFETGVTAKAHALRFFGDKYDESIGINVAYNRALGRLARKNEKYFIRLTEPVERWNDAATTSR